MIERHCDRLGVGQPRGEAPPSPERVQFAVGWAIGKTISAQDLPAWMAEMASSQFALERAIRLLSPTRPRSNGAFECERTRCAHCRELDGLQPRNEHDRAQTEYQQHRADQGFDQCLTALAGLPRGSGMQAPPVAEGFLNGSVSGHDPPQRIAAPRWARPIAPASRD